jgi:hypothetical protein
MTEYNFIADFLDTFQSSPDWIKALWLLIPPSFLLAFVAMLLNFRRSPAKPSGELIYAVYRGSDDNIEIIRNALLLENRADLPALEQPAQEAGDLLTGRQDQPDH